MTQSAEQEERDINDIFDDIVLVEEREAERSYEEGTKAGQQQGHREGYKLGYAQGVQLGNELGEIYGTVVAQQQQQGQSSRVSKTLQQLREAIEAFPRNNDPEADIVGALEHIRTLNKRMCAMLHIPVAELSALKETSTSKTINKSAAANSKDFSF